MFTTSPVPGPNSHQDARAVQKAMRRAGRTGRASRAAVAFDRARGDVVRPDRTVNIDTAATILAGLRTDAGRDAVTLVALGLDPLAAAFDTEHSGQHHLNRVFDMVNPLQPDHDHHLALDVLTHLCAVAPKDIRFVVLAQASFLAWFLRMRPEAVAFLNAAIDANPEAMTEYRLGAVVHQDVEPGHAIQQSHTGTHN